MANERTFFHDRYTLLVLTVNTFLALVCVVMSLLPLAGSGGAVIAEYRSNLGLAGYRAGSMLDIVSFGVFAAIVYSSQVFIGTKIYHIRKRASMIVLLLTTVLLLFAIVVLSALLDLR
jgi:hypothetical protein